jgi:TonB family protein
MSMHRLTATCILAAALACVGGHAHAGEALVTIPVLDFKQCGRPDYPPSALRNEEEGYVLLGVHVNAEGDVLETRILLSTGTPALDEATDAAFRHCRYAPGKVNGQPAAMWTVIHYVWTLEPSEGKTVTRLSKAAIEGDAASRYLLGAFLDAHATTDAERNKAHDLQVSAAEAGDPMAQVAVGGMYEKGKRLPKDMDAARLWFGLAAAQGNVYAIDHLRFIAAVP